MNLDRQETLGQPKRVNDKIKNNKEKNGEFKHFSSDEDYSSFKNRDSERAWEESFNDEK